MASRETQAIIDYIEASGLAFKVTDINTPRVHAAASFHYAAGTDGQGLAVDLAGTTPGDVVQMNAIFAAFKPVANQLAELIYKAPGVAKVVKAGKWVDPLVAYGAKTWAAHTNHVHVATYKGTFLRWPEKPATVVTKKVYPMYEPPLVIEPIVADLACPTGGAWCLAASGAIYAWGGASHLGQPRDKNYFKGRKAARLEPVDGKYRVIAESGEPYGPGFDE